MRSFHYISNKVPNGKKPLGKGMYDSTKTSKTEYLNSSNAVTEYWDYDNGLVFKNNAFYQLNTAEGRALFVSNAWQQEYQYKDHLGNTRVSFSREAGQLKVKDIADFDPWGIVLETNGSSLNPENRWKLQGKEKESTYGLNRIMFGARTYNPTIGRFDGVDPLADTPHSLGLSPYNYASNNPINRIDPDGALDEPIYKKHGILLVIFLVVQMLLEILKVFQLQHHTLW